VITRAFRILWRCLIFTLGAICLWLTVRYFIPFVDQRIPSFFTLLAAYCLLAYFVIPTLIRLFRLFIKPNHIPLYVTTGDGWPSDPVNIAVVVHKEKDLTAIMTAAGWHKADPMNIKNALRGAKSFIFNKPYAAAPLSSLYLFDRKHELGFEIPTNRAGSMRTRHHVRFWRLDEPKRKHTRHAHTSFWQEQLRHLFTSKKEIWIGAATEEPTPIDIQWYTGRFTHGGSHDSDRERDYIIDTLRKANSVRRVSTTEAGEEKTFRGQQFRTIYVTDGSIKVVELK
jgi:hypothetical protein